MDKSILQKATLDTPDPTPGWLYTQIDAMTNSSVEACTSVENWLMKRLQDDSPHVKRKVLLVIKHSAELGHQDFCRAIQRRSEEIRKYSTYRGPQDPLLGDSVNQSVRDAANEALSSIFNRGNMTNASMGRQNNAPSRMAGFGPESFSSNSGGSYESSSPHPYPSPPAAKPAGSIASQGFGNPAFANTNKPETKQESWGEWMYKKIPFVSGAGASKPFTPDPENYASFLNYQNDSFTPPQIGATSPSYGGSSGYSGGNSYSNGSSSPSGGYNNPVTVNTSASVNTNNSSAPRFPSEQRQPGKPVGGWGGQDEPSRPKASDSSGTLESKIVEEITSSSGVRTLPQRQDLTRFVARCATADSNIIAALLDEKLCSQTWQVRLKALFAVESLIKGKNAVIADYFATNSENIEECTLSVQASVADKASKVLRLLDKKAPVISQQQLEARANYMANASAEERDAASSNTGSGSLFDFDMDTQSSTQSTTTTTTTKQSSNNNVDELFSGLEIKDQPIASPNATTITAGSSSSSSSSNSNSNSNSNSEILNMFLSAPTVSPSAVPTHNPQQHHHMAAANTQVAMTVPMPMQMGVPMQMGMPMMYYPAAGAVPQAGMPMYWVPSHGAAAAPGMGMRPAVPNTMVSSASSVSSQGSSFSFISGSNTKSPSSGSDANSNANANSNSADPFDFVRASMTVSK